MRSSKLHNQCMVKIKSFLKVSTIKHNQLLSTMLVPNL
uniref:Uncharacterized protein MANES_11G155700 n=1 Tax=Rhizophora mucronata TaxID=61149 RepID=A0A2P2MSV4_RHIMU